VAPVITNDEKPCIVVTTDVNGTTTPDNTFAELVRADGLYDEMAYLMSGYTSGECRFSEVLPRMRHLAGKVDRQRLVSYASTIPLYAGVIDTVDELTQSGNLDAQLALSTTGFAGLMALVNRLHHNSLLHVAASPVLIELLLEEEKSCLIRPITDEEEKTKVIDDLVGLYKPSKRLIFHVGDTMGDFPGIKHVAALGGIGIGFNPNEVLRTSIAGLSQDYRTRICEIIFSPHEEPDYSRVGDVIKEAVWQRLGTNL
jgi:phosphoserine phosphatase